LLHDSKLIELAPFFGDLAVNNPPDRDATCFHGLSGRGYAIPIAGIGATARP
jgi:hypothetical protein